MHQRLLRHSAPVDASAVAATAIGVDKNVMCMLLDVAAMQELHDPDLAADQALERVCRRKATKS